MVCTDLDRSVDASPTHNATPPTVNLSQRPQPSDDQRTFLNSCTVRLFLKAWTISLWRWERGTEFYYRTSVRPRLCLSCWLFTISGFFFLFPTSASLSHHPSGVSSSSNTMPRPPKACQSCSATHLTCQRDNSDVSIPCVRCRKVGKVCVPPVSKRSHTTSEVPTYSSTGTDRHVNGEQQCSNPTAGSLPDNNNLSPRRLEKMRDTSFDLQAQEREVNNQEQDCADSISSTPYNATTTAEPYYTSGHTSTGPIERSDQGPSGLSPAQKRELPTAANQLFPAKKKKRTSVHPATLPQPMTNASDEPRQPIRSGAQRTAQPSSMFWTYPQQPLLASGFGTQPFFQSAATSLSQIAASLDLPDPLGSISLEQLGIQTTRPPFPTGVPINTRQSASLNSSEAPLHLLEDYVTV